MSKPATLPDSKRDLVIDAIADLERIDRERDSRRTNYGYKYYVPNPKQKEAHLSTSKRIIFIGGNRSGKSTCGAAEVAWHITKDYPTWFPVSRRFIGPVKIGIVSTENPIIEKVIEPKLKQFLPKIPPYKMRRVSGSFLQKVLFQDGSTIDILTGEQDDMAFEGQDWDFCWIDEPTQKRKYEAIERGMVDRGGTVLFTFTPLIEPWMKDDLVDRADGKEIHVIQVDIRDNKFDVEGKPILTEDNIKRFEDKIPEDVRETRIHGKFFHLRGVVYPEFADVHKIRFDYEEGLPVIVSLDPHDRLPHHVIWAILDKTNDLYIHSELTVRGTVSELARCIRQMERTQKYHVKRRIIDPNFGRKPLITTGRTVIQELSVSGCGGWIEGQDALEEGRLKVKEYLHYDRTRPLDLDNKPKLYFHRDRVPITIKSITNHQYEEWSGKVKTEKDPKEKVKDKDTHGADCVRYLCMSNPRHQSFRVRESEFASSPY